MTTLWDAVADRWPVILVLLGLVSATVYAAFQGVVGTAASSATNVLVQRLQRRLSWLRRPRHPSYDTARRGIQRRCRFTIDPLYEDEYLWRANADLLIELVHPADLKGRSGFLIASPRAPAEASSTRVLKKRDGRWQRKQLFTKQFVERSSNQFRQEFDGSCFAYTDRDGGNSRIKAYLNLYDDYLSARW